MSERGEEERLSEAMLAGLVDNLSEHEMGRALAAIVKAVAPLLPAETEEQRASLQRVLDAVDKLLEGDDEPEAER